MPETTVHTGEAAAKQVAGFSIGTARCGLKSSGADVLVLAATSGAVPAAAAFTRNHTAAAPVLYSRQAIKAGRAAAVVANSGNANCLTGPDGLRAAAETARLAAERLGRPGAPVLVASTGIIGRPLDMSKLSRGIEAAIGNLGAGTLHDAAAAAMTTDTFPKIASVHAPVAAEGMSDGFTVAGVAKGAGMIAPNMATMLAFILTDAAASSTRLGRAIGPHAAAYFNAVTVDGDTSTNDTLVVLASGASGCQASGGAFERALAAVSETLARMIARDGEGATKLVEVRVSGARSSAGARRIARAIAESPLVKTAIHGADPNWGRILAAAGRAGTSFVPERATLSINGVPLFAAGSPTGREADARASMTASEILIELDCRLGKVADVMHTCDLSRDYIRINAEYHT